MGNRQDVVVELFYGGAWNVAPAYVRDPVTITRGFRDEGSGLLGHGTADLTLDNRSTDYNPGNAASALYGLIGRNTPIRIGLDLAADTFGTASSSGWPGWTGSGAAAADFTVSAGLGRHLQPLKNIIRVSRIGADRRDVEQVTDASIPAVAVGASVVVGHVARYQSPSGDRYWLRLEFDVGGALTAKISKLIGGTWTDLAVRSAIPGLTYTAGQSYTLRSSVSGSRLSLRMWPTGTPEPTGWTLTAYDGSITAAGRYGLASWVVAGNTNTTEVRFDNYRAVDRRYYGEVAAWKPNRTVDFNPAAGKGDAWTEVEAAGILRRLSQGKQPALSPMRRTIAASGPLAYWPIEDGGDATRAASAVAGVPAATVTSAVEFTTVEDLALPDRTLKYGTQKLVNLAAGGTITATVPAGPATAWTVAVTMQVDPVDYAADVVILEWTTPGGTYDRWQIVATKAWTGPEGDWTEQLIAYPASGAAPVRTRISTSVSSSFNLWTASAEQVGGNIATSLNGRATVSIAGTLAPVASVKVNATGTTSTTPMPAGHLVVWPRVQPFDAVVASALSNVGEAAVDRLARIAAEAGIPLDMPPVPAGWSVIRMGRQPVATLTDLLTEPVAVDGGFLYESRDMLGLDYRPHSTLYNQERTMTVDYAAGQVHPPFAPVLDDLDVRNDITVKRKDGSSARAVRTTGPRAAVPAEDGGIGVYATEVELNLADDSKLADNASWRLHVAAPE